MNNADRKSQQTTAPVLLAAGLLAAITGCAGKQQARQSAPVRQIPPAALASGETSAPHPAAAPARAQPQWVSGTKLDPLWISMTAENPQRPAAPASPSAGSPDPMTLASSSAMVTPPPVADDSTEGLAHVTFAPEGADFDPSVSRDGQFMVFASTQHRPTADIYYKSTGGRTVTQLTSDPANDVMPCISPDGQRVAFASSRSGNWDVYVMSITGGQAVQVTSDPAHELHPTWSPDGKHLAFCRMGQMSGRWEMWVCDASGGGASEFIGFGLFPQWCPVAKTGGDGRDKILFQRSRERGDHAFAVWTIDYKPGDASSPTEIVAGSGSAMINACWSPDGARIVYSVIDNAADLSAGATARGPRLPMSNLWMTSVDGSQRVSLTAGRFMNLMPCWGADNRIYFVSDRTGTPNVWSIGTDKAITAATGNKVNRTNTDVANVPTDSPAADQPGH